MSQVRRFTFWVIQKTAGTGGRRFVAPPGREKSYTRNVLHARRFHSREEAEREKCGNEAVVEVSA